MTSLRLFLATSPGLESALIKETKRILGAPSQVTSKQGGVELNGTFSQMWRLAHLSRCASDVRVRLCRPFEAQNLPQLSRRLDKVPWHAWLAPNQPFTISVTARKSVLYHTEAIELRILESLQKLSKLASTTTPTTTSSSTPSTSFIESASTESTSSLSNPIDDSHHHHQEEKEDHSPELIYARISKNTVTISLNVGRLDRPHWQRGYRQHVIPGSLRENIASSLLELCDVVERPPSALWNPFAGSGVFGTEAFLLQTPQLSCAHRFQLPLAFTSYLNFDENAYQSWLAGSVRVDPPQDPPMPIFCSDLSERAIRAARHNAGQLGFSSMSCMVGDSARIVSKIPHNAMMIANLPYGKQCRGSPTTILEKFCDTLRYLQRPDLLERAYFLLPTTTHLKLPHRVLTTFKNGGINVQFIQLVSN